MTKTLTLDVTSFKFADNETDLKFRAMQNGVIISDSTLSATIKIKQVDVGYLKSVSAKWVDKRIVISSGDLSDLPVGSYSLELWLSSSSGYEIYPDSGFVNLSINQNATGISSNLISSITLNEFQQQFSDLSKEVNNNIELKANQTDLESLQYAVNNQTATISTKANKTDLDNLQTTVTSQGVVISTKANQTDLDNLKTDVTSQGVVISTKANQTDLDNLKTDVTSQGVVISTNNSRLLSIESGLAETNAQVDLLNRGLGETFTTLVALQTAYPTGDTKDHIVGADGHRYFWNGAVWADGGAYQAIEVADDSITLKKLKSVPTSKNITDPNNAVLGKYMDPNGTIITNSGYNIYGPFSVVSGEVIRAINTVGQVIKFRKVAAKNSSGAFSIKDGFNSTESLEYYTVPADITQIYVSISTNWIPNDLMIYKGAPTVLFEQPYKRALTNLTVIESNLTPRSVTSGKIALKAVKSEHVSFIKASDNLFNSETITDNALKELTGSTTVNSNYFYSDFINVSEGDVIKASHRTGRNVHLRKVTTYSYDRSILISSGQDGGSVSQVVDAVSEYIVPSGVAYVIVSISKVNPNGSFPQDLMISIGTAVPEFSSYSEQLQSVNVPIANVENLSGTLDIIQTEIEALGGVVLEDETLLNLGDSIAAGARNTYGDGLTAKSYGLQIAQRNGMNYITRAVGGAKLSRQVDVNNVCAQVDSAISDGLVVDRILIEGGTNDISSNCTQGTITAGYADVFDENTSIGSLEYCFKRIRDTWPHAKVLFVRVHNMSSRDATKQKNLGNAILEVCQKWSIPVVDLYKEGGINTNLVNVRNLYCNWTYAPEKGDGTHPNTLGYATWYVPPIEAKLKSI